MRIRTMFNNWYAVMKLRPDIAALSKDVVYSIWLEGYGIAIKNLCEDNKK